MFSVTAFTYDGSSISGIIARTENNSSSYGRTASCYDPSIGKPFILFEKTEESARRELWKYEYESLEESEKSIILAVFPNVLSTDKLLKNPKKIYKIAISKIDKAGLTKTCPRCGGTGNYSFNMRDGTVCFKCGGAKRVLPNVTKAFISKLEFAFKDNLI